MSRFVSAWLPRWPILRFLRAQSSSPSGAPVDADLPFILIVNASGGSRIATLNAAAEAEGLRVGDQVADARARVGVLQVRAVDPVADAAALRRLALWATRYTPAVSPWREENGADGLFLDITGVAHLFGGEEALLADLSRRLVRFGLKPRLAVADTPGAAWAASHFRPPNTVIAAGGEAAELASLPVEALRLAPDTRTTLRRLGFKRVGQLIDKPRAPFAARFPTELLHRLDQALGRAPEPLALIVPPPLYRSLRQLLEPISTQEAIVAVATHLMEDLLPSLVRDGVGARSLQLCLYRIDGEVSILDIGLTLPTRSPAHVARLIDLKLERLVESIDAGFGFGAIGLTATVPERIKPKQTEFVRDTEGERAERCAALIDSLAQRLGPRSVRRLAPAASHLPERAEAPSTAAETPVWPAPDCARPRPLLLLPRAEQADEVVALVPEGPPKRFRWRGATHRIVQAQGPERIAGEWWRHRQRQPTRDYYMAEDARGHRFWLYREGLYGIETSEPRWFVHGVFA